MPRAPSGGLSAVELDRLIARLAGAQHGVVARTQLLGAGASSDAIKHRLLSARLHRLHRGVYAVGHENVGDLGRELAGVLACGPDALLALFSAGGRCRR